MASKTTITPNNIHGWLAALGYIFPSTEGELLRFEKFYAEMVIPEDELIDPEVILGRKPKKQPGKVTNMGVRNNQPLKMAARNGIAGIPQHILDKMQKNQQKRPDNDGGNTEEKVD